MAQGGMIARPVKAAEALEHNLLGLVAVSRVARGLGKLPHASGEKQVAVDFRVWRAAGRAVAIKTSRSMLVARGLLFS